MTKDRNTGYNIGLP